MSTQRFTPEFKEEAVRQVVDHGYSVAEVSARLGVPSHSLYKWVKAVTPDKTEKQAAGLVEAKSEILRLRAQCVAHGNGTTTSLASARWFQLDPLRSRSTS